MGLNFITELPDDTVQPRSGHTETARELKANPTSTGWADITKDGGYSKRATATAAAKEINDHTHDAYRDYGYEATVRTVKQADGSEQHLLFARYNPTADKAGELAPATPKKARKSAASKGQTATVAPVSDDQSTGDQSAPAPAESPVSATVAAPATPARATAKAPAAKK